MKAAVSRSKEPRLYVVFFEIKDLYGGSPLEKVGPDARFPTGDGVRNRERRCAACPVQKGMSFLRETMRPASYPPTLSRV